MGDVDVVCTLANGTHRGQDGPIKGKAITVGDRFAKRSECSIPNVVSTDEEENDRHRRLCGSTAQHYTRNVAFGSSSLPGASILSYCRLIR
jgi:hypothetical protein